MGNYTVHIFVPQLRPLQTSDDNCTNADRGVGIARAAGSHLENGIWALLVIAATRTPNCEFRKSKMADGRHFEIIKAPSDFDEV